MATQVTTPAFRRDMSWRNRGIFRGNLCVEQSENSIAETIQNLTDFALEIEKLLHQDASIIVGFAVSHPDLFKTQVGGN